MAEEITNEAIVEESPLQETTAQESQIEPSLEVESAPPDDEKGKQIRFIYELLDKDKAYTQFVPKSYDEFVTTLAKDVKFAKGVHALIANDKDYSQYLPATFEETIQYFGLGKPSAVPSASVGGGSATKGRGLEQPSTLQPREANVDNQFGLGGIAAQVGKETELSKEVNAFENYEDKQSYFAKVDKAKREIVDNKNSSYVLPNTEEGQRIYKDATGLRYDFLKREANAAQVKMSASLNPIINKDIDEKYLTKNDDGFLVPDVEKIDKYAKDLAKRYNLPEDGYLKEVIYNEAKSTASYKEIESEVNRKFEKLIQPNLVSTGLIEKSNQEVWKNFTTDEVEQAELDKKVGVLAADLKVKSKADQDAIQYELQNQVSNLDESFNQTDAQITAQYANIENQRKSGQLPYEQYVAAFNNLKQSSEQAYAAYSDDRLKLFDQGQKALNQINNKYNSQLRRQAEELNNIARQKVSKAAEEYQKKYGKNPQLEAQIKKLYEKAYLETVNAKNNEVDKYNKNRTTELVLKYKQFGGMAAMADRFLRSVDSAAGGSLKGLGTSLGINSLQVYGDFLQGSVTLPEAKTKEFKDLFDPLNLSQVSGQLAGGMAPMIAASAVVGAATQNAPLMYQMAATGAASFFTESADIAGRMHDEIFATTQSAAKANEASEKSWEAQYKIIPLYAFSGLPFIKAAGTWMKTLPRVSRVALGAAAEIAEEIPQEVTQNINEENIRAGLDPFDNYYKKISEDDWKRLKETAISVAPVALLGGAGQISGPREISNKKLMQQQVSSYAAQAKVNELVGNMQGQWVSQMVSKKGEAFAVTTINSLFADGTIDEQTRDQLQENVTTSKKNFEDAKTLGLSQSEGVVYDALTQAYLQKKAQFEQAQQNGDEILADNLNQEMTNIRNQTKDFAQNKQGDFFVFQFADGSQKIVSNSKWSTDTEILDLIASDQISVLAYSDNGKALLDSLKPKVEEQKVAQEERKTKTLADDIEVGDTVDLTPKSTALKSDIKARRDAELEPVNLAIAESERTGQVPVVNGEPVNKKTIDDINAKYDAELNALKKQTPTTTSENQVSIENRSRKDLFPDESEFADVIGGSGQSSKISSYREVNGIGISEYTNPENGLVDVIMTGTSDNDYVGYVRIYENSIPTNRWTSKMENKSGNKANFKTMINEVKKSLPEGHEYTEKTNISLDGLRVFAKNLQKGYEFLRDKAGDIVTNNVELNNATLEKLRGAKTEEEVGELYERKTGITREEFNKIKESVESILPNTRLIFNETNGSVIVRLPVLVSTPTTKAQAPVAEEAKGEATPTDINTKKADIENRIVITGTDGGFEVYNTSNIKNEKAGTIADVRRKYSDDKYEVEFGKGDDKKSIFSDINIGEKKSYHYFITDKKTKKRYYVVGISSRVAGTDPQRDGSLFATIEDDGNITDFTRTVLELALIKEFENQTKKRKGIFKPLPQEFIDKVNNTYAELVAEEKQTSTSEQAPQPFPAQEGAESVEEKWQASGELEQIYRDLQKSVMANVDEDTIRILKANPTEAMMNKLMETLKKKGIIEVDCN